MFCRMTNWSYDKTDEARLLVEHSNMLLLGWNVINQAAPLWWHVNLGTTYLNVPLATVHHLYNGWWYSLAEKFLPWRDCWWALQWWLIAKAMPHCSTGQLKHTQLTIVSWQLPKQRSLMRFPIHWFQPNLQLILEQFWPDRLQDVTNDNTGLRQNQTRSTEFRTITLSVKLWLTKQTNPGNQFHC